MDSHHFYNAMNMRSAQKVASTARPTIGLTEHILSETERVVIAINYEPFDDGVDLQLAAGWTCSDCFSINQDAKLSGDLLRLPHNNGAVLMLKADPRK